MAKSKGIREFQRLLRLREAGMARLYLENIQDIKKKAILTEVVRIIGLRPDAPDIDAIIDALDLDEGRFAPLATWIATSWKVGGGHFVDRQPPVRLPSGARAKISFDVTNPRVERKIREQSSDLIREIVSEQRGVIQLALSQSFELGRNPRQAGLDIVGRLDRRTRKRVGGVIGLTRYQYGWVGGALTELIAGDEISLSSYLGRELRNKRFDGYVKRAIESKEPIDRDVIERMVQAYENNALRYRGNAIGRTETLRALNGGRAEGMEQMLERTGIDRRFASKAWDATGDARTRTTHIEAEAQGAIPIGTLFRVGDYWMEHPGDRNGGPEEVINCRCYLAQEVDWIAAEGGDPA